MHSEVWWCQLRQYGSTSSGNIESVCTVRGVCVCVGVCVCGGVCGGGAYRLGPPPLVPGWASVVGVALVAACTHDLTRWSDYSPGTDNLEQIIQLWPGAVHVHVCLSTVAIMISDSGNLFSK